MRFCRNSGGNPRMDPKGIALRNSLQNFLEKIRGGLPGGRPMIKSCRKAPETYPHSYEIHLYKWLFYYKIVKY